MRWTISNTGRLDDGPVRTTSPKDNSLHLLIYFDASLDRFLDSTPPATLPEPIGLELKTVFAKWLRNRAMVAPAPYLRFRVRGEVVISDALTTALGCLWSIVTGRHYLSLQSIRSRRRSSRLIPAM